MHFRDMVTFSVENTDSSLPLQISNGWLEWMQRLGLHVVSETFAELAFELDSSAQLPV